MKMLNLDKFKELKQKQLSLNEIKNLEKLNHPHVLKSYSSFEDNKNNIYLIIDYVNNENISDFINSYKKLHTNIPEEIITIYVRIKIYSLKGINS